MDFVLSELVEQVLAARGAEKHVVIRGGGTKNFYGEWLDGQGPQGAVELDLTAYHGMVDYHPSELVVTVRAGTPLSVLEAMLDEQGQMLAFEPPRLGAASTIGGCVAAGLSGPRRMAAGSVRDYILGVRLLDASGSVLSFGGEVMKNVAGYDVSRLMAGAMGMYGALLELSIKVVPKPFAEHTLVFDLDAPAALSRLNQWRSQPLPISASCWSDHQGRGQLWVRLSGSQSALAAAVQVLGGDTLPHDQALVWWNSLRDQTHPFFSGKPLWRIALPPVTPDLALGPTLIEWNGAQRWVVTDQDPAALRAHIAQLGGHATLYRASVRDAHTSFFHPLPPAVRTLNWRLKQSLDPVGLFNPKRLFPDF